MTLHRRRRRSCRTAALALAACAALAAPAGAVPATDPAQPTATRIGDTPADFAQPVAPAPRIGDTPADAPGASRAPQYVSPTTVRVVQPQRTIVRDANDALPTILASLALFIALGGTGYALLRTRSMRRGVVGGSH
jgi:hypothetical protein